MDQLSHLTETAAVQPNTYPMIVTCACSEVACIFIPSLATRSTLLDYGRRKREHHHEQARKEEIRVRTHVCSIVPLASTIAPCVLIPLPLDPISIGVDDPASSSALQFEKIEYETLVINYTEHTDRRLTRSSSSYRSPSYSRSYYRSPQPIRRYSRSASSS